MVGGLCRGLSAAEARREARDKLELLGLAEVAELSPRKLPTGHLKLLDFLRVLMLHPRLMLLDELMAGLSIHRARGRARRRRAPCPKWRHIPGG